MRVLYAKFSREAQARHLEQVLQDITTKKS